ncbi:MULTISPECIES: hypothetical protein [unclassified Microcoleus]|uniref:hypothetical protein n=1 Tax=unclassified Microcoleus TaxID=2642155 RepID=UPI002FD41EDA
MKVSGRADSQTSGLNSDLIMYGLTPHPVNCHIVTNSVMPIAHMTDKFLYTQGFAQRLSPLTNNEGDARRTKTQV